MLGASNSSHVDAVEKHCELGGVHFDRSTITDDAWCLKSPLLQALVIEDQSAPIPKQDLATISSTSQEHKQMPGKQVHTPLAAHNAAQAIVSSTKIYWLDGEVDPHTRRKRQHG